VPDLLPPWCLALYINGLVQCEISGTHIPTLLRDRPFCHAGRLVHGISGASPDRISDKIRPIDQKDRNDRGIGSGSSKCCHALTSSETLDATIRHAERYIRTFASKIAVPDRLLI
jgi:hypothetical protein